MHTYVIFCDVLGQSSHHDGIVWGLWLIICSFFFIAENIYMKFNCKEYSLPIFVYQNLLYIKYWSLSSFTVSN